jgi:two-component system cell cycle sensor histidine kinase/response regulator CckA
MAEPIAIAAQAEIPEEAAWFRATEAIGAVQTVLFVEDEAFVRGVASEVLRSAGYRVLVARDASEATCAYDAHHRAVDLLLSDVILPGESGRELAARLRRDDPRLKVLLITGYMEQMNQPAGGVEECLAKPFSVEVLLRKVREVLDCGKAPAAEQDWVRRACGNA